MNNELHIPSMRPKLWCCIVCSDKKPSDICFSICLQIHINHYNTFVCSKAILYNIRVLRCTFIATKWNRIVGSQRPK
ncbi:hypothetical protein M0802_011589 [Mischocyttarus mexicanus]|nr:hypothetical protein M0802_011589 [Mischocyttarus mexicanus]